MAHLLWIGGHRNRLEPQSGPGNRASTWKVGENWQPERDLNPHPAVLETAALPLSYRVVD